MVLENPFFTVFVSSEVQVSERSGHHVEAFMMLAQQIINIHKWQSDADMLRSSII